MRPLKLLFLLLRSKGTAGTFPFSRHHSLTAKTSPSACTPHKNLSLHSIPYNDCHPIDRGLLVRRGEDMLSLNQEKLHGNTGVDLQQSRPSDLLSYYLLWSPAMRQKAIVSGLCLGIIHFFSSTFFSEVAQKESLTRITGGFIGNAVLPLLSSACCSIQLIINSLASAGGCAGFNSYLGPVRPYFFSLLVYLTIISRTDLSVRRWIIESFVRFSLALLPEMVHWSNNYRTRKWTIKKRIKIEHGHPHTQLQEAQIELDIPTMGCVACINKIDAAIRSTAPLQIISSESWLDSARRKGGNSLIRLSVSSKEEADFIAESIVEKVEQAGFDSCRVESMLVVDSCESEAL